MMQKKKNRMRKSTKYIVLAISIIVIIFSLIDFIKRLQEENMNVSTKEIYKYTNKFNYDYKINLLQNKYMTDKEIEDKSLVYVTDLIDNINLNLNYEYLADKKTNIKCTYSITGKMQAVYVKNNEEQKIWEKEETLVEPKSIDVDSNRTRQIQLSVLVINDENLRY